METTKRRDAAIMGLSKYFTGTVCNRGHLSERYVSTGQCVECLSETRKSFSRKSNSHMDVDRINDNFDKIIQQLDSKFNVSVNNLSKKFDLLTVKFNEVKVKYETDTLKYGSDLIDLNISLNSSKAEVEKRRQQALDFASRGQEYEAAKTENITQRMLDITRRQAAAHIRTVTLGQFIKTNIIVHMSDVEKTQQYLLDLSLARCSNLLLDDIWLSRTPKQSVLYKILIHPDDQLVFNAFCKANYEPHGQVTLEDIRKNATIKLREMLKEPKNVPIGYDEADMKSTFK